jgi:hypothetical protein
MGKSTQPKTDNLGWIIALLFPKKSKPVQPAPVQPQTTITASPKAEETQPEPTEKTENSPRLKGLAPAFWTVASVLSMIVNIILIIILLIVARELFTIKSMVGDGLLGGLYENFILMDEAHIKTTIEVQANVPIEFTLPVQTNTTVQLTEDTRIEGARVTLNTGGLNILSAPTNIILPAGTVLPIALDISVPVNTTIPITLQVPVDIPLEETELHKPFVGLQEVVDDYYWMLQPQIKRPADLPFCKFFSWPCEIFFR